MCGRFSMHLPTKTIAEFFMSLQLNDVQPRYNIAPTQGVLACLQLPDQPGKRQLFFLHWGLIPQWAKERDIAHKLINARGETLASKPSFRGAYAYRRCLIPASGFFEWQKRGKAKQPIYITSALNQPLAFAGLWEHWSGPDGEEITSCTIITCEPNDVMSPIHNRMPVILAQADFERWLDPTLTNSKSLDPLLVPCPNEWLTTWPVGRHVGNVHNDDARCIQPIDPGPQEEQLSLF